MDVVLANGMTMADVLTGKEMVVPEKGVLIQCIQNSLGGKILGKSEQNKLWASCEFKIKAALKPAEKSANQ